MNRPVVVIPILMIVNACIWGFTIIMCSYTLRGTGAYQQIQHIMAGGLIMSLIVVGGGLAGVVKTLKSKE